MSRLFWVSLGAAAGVYLAHRATRAATAMTPRGLSESLAESIREVGDALGYLVTTVRTAAAEREADLYDTLGVPTDDARPLRGRAQLEVHG